MTPKSIKRPRESYQSMVITPSQAQKQLLFSDTISDGDSMDSDVEVIHFDPDCILEDPDLDEEEDEFEEWESLESCMDEEVEVEEFLDATQGMETDSLDESTSSDVSIDPDCFFTDDEEAMEEYLIYKQARRQQKQALRRMKQLEEEEFDVIDEINIRYLISGVPSKKPCTMTSAAGRAAHMNMRRIVMPAREMLRNYFRSSERNRMQRAKENAYVSKILAARGKVKAVRNVLSEKN
ncbi:uncharacterized protein LOC135708600 isoform X1 [Ochlerotatus camptorhynchus]|uniref:uncharacterized protein LOC135708600 isoform X1 n=1 Tax=Ochlerotatus camptorhynchus TaxID=644619 RepID=UPI0031D18F9A